MDEEQDTGANKEQPPILNDNHEDTSSKSSLCNVTDFVASNSAGSNNPATRSTSSARQKPRRRRLANRRQYNKSRRLASSYARTQFVKYDDFHIGIDTSNDRKDDDLSDEARSWLPGPTERYNAWIKARETNPSGRSAMSEESSSSLGATTSGQGVAPGSKSWRSDDLSVSFDQPMLWQEFLSMSPPEMTGKFMNHETPDTLNLQHEARRSPGQHSVDGRGVYLANHNGSSSLDSASNLDRPKKSPMTSSYRSKSASATARGMSFMGGLSVWPRSDQKPKLHHVTPRIKRQPPVNQAELSKDLSIPTTCNADDLSSYLLSPNSPCPSQYSLPHSESCIDNVQFSKIHAPNDNNDKSVRADPRLYKDDVDIKFSRALNSCKLPQIRYASKQRLFERLTDLRFLSIDFLNTFLLTYKVFSNPEEVFSALKSVHYDCEKFYHLEQQRSMQQQNHWQISKAEQDINDQLGKGISGSRTPSLGSRINLPESVYVHQTKDNCSGRASDTVALIEDNRRQQVLDPTRTSNDRKMDKQELCQQEQQQQIRSQQRPPAIPPRSPTSSSQIHLVSKDIGSDNSRHGKNKSDSESEGICSNFLQRPRIQVTQKRRSTINELTPITGSTSSSLTNLAASNSQLANNLDNIAGKCSDIGVDIRRSLPSTKNRQHTRTGKSLGFNENLDELLSSRMMEDEADYLLPKNYDLESTSPNLHAGSCRSERSRSMSMVCSPRSPNSSDDANVLESVNLLVPAPRQTRANSFSQVDTTRRAVGSLVITSPLIGGGNHWRLSYRKSEDKGRPKHGNDSTGINSPESLHRRASLPDADVTFEVIPPASPPPMSPQFLGSKLEVADTSEDKQEDSTVFVQTPVAPPSTPIECQDIDASISDRDVAENESFIIDRQSKGNSSLLSVRGSVHNKRHRRHTICKSPTSSSVSLASGSSTSSQGSAATKSVQTSQSESGLIQTTSESSSTTSYECLSENGPKDKFKIDENNSSKRSSRSSTKVIKSFTLKGIELTEAKILDSDTSADEDKISTSSNDDDRDDMGEDGHRIRRDEELPSELVQSEAGNSEIVDKEMSEEERSFLILKRLNSVNLEGDDDEEDSEKDECPVLDKIHSAPHEQVSKNQKSIDDKSIVSSRMEEQSSCELKSKTFREQQPIEYQSKQDEPVLEHPEMMRPFRSTSETPDLISEASLGSSICNRAFGGSEFRVDPTISSRMSTPRGSVQQQMAPTEERLSKAGVIVSGSMPRVSSRRSSIASSVSAFAAATAGASNAILTQPPQAKRQMHIQMMAQQGRMIQDCECYEANGGQRPSYQVFHRQCPRASQFNSQTHLPSCTHYQSSTSLVNQTEISAGNSRSSSRLSSCAGFETTYPSLSHLNSASQYCRTDQGSENSSLNQHFQRELQDRNSDKKNKSPVNLRSLATIRVLSVLKHWHSKNQRDFLEHSKLSQAVEQFLSELMNDATRLPAERKAALSLLQVVEKSAATSHQRINLEKFIDNRFKDANDTIETLPALDVAEAMTFIDHKIFLAIKSEEFLGQAWMKADKAVKAPNILMITKRFNEISRLISSEIVRVPDIHRRVAIIEKWTNVAHICRVVHNFNGVLQICAAFTNSAVFRLKKTWDKIPKATKITIDQLQNLVSTDSKFRNMRDAISRCDPPCIPYVGMYLTDLSFIEEGTPNYSPDGLLNFSKMRMIAHVIREIQHQQVGSYKINLNPRVATYLLSTKNHLADEEMYRHSLAMEPKSTNAKNGVQMMNRAVAESSQQQTASSPTKSRARS